MECYELDKGPGEEQMEGWPKVVNMLENDGREPYGYLHELVIEGLEKPVIQVINSADKEILYTVRSTKNIFIPKVFEDGKYTVKVGSGEDNKWKTFKNIRPLKGKVKSRMHVKF